jgi:hypothetical protein
MCLGCDALSEKKMLIRIRTQDDASTSCYHRRPTATNGTGRDERDKYVWHDRGDTPRTGRSRSVTVQRSSGRMQELSGGAADDPQVIG